MTSSRSPRSSTASVFDGTIWGFLGEALALPTGLFTAGFLTRHLGLSDYGLFTLISVQVSWLEWTMVSLLTRITIRLISETTASGEDSHPAAETALFLHIVGGLLVAGVLTIAAPFLSVLFHESRLTPYLLLFALDIPLFCAGYAHRSILAGLGRYRHRATLSATRWMGRLICIVLGAYFLPALWGAVAGSMGASVLELIVGRIWICPTPRLTHAFPIQRFFAFAVPLFLCAAALRLYEKLDLLALKALGASAAAVGLYGAAQNLAVIPGLLSMSLAPLLLSSLTRAIATNDTASAQALSRNALRGLFALLPFIGLVAGTAREIVSTVFGASFREASIVLSWLFAGGIGLAMVASCLAILTARGKEASTAWLAGVMVVLALFGYGIVRGLHGGLSETAMVFAGVAWCGAFASIELVRRAAPFAIPVGTFLRGILLAIILGIGGSLWHGASNIELLGKLVVGTVCVPIGFLLFGEVSLDERHQIVAEITSRLTKSHRSV